MFSVACSFGNFSLLLQWELDFLGGAICALNKVIRCCPVCCKPSHGAMLFAWKYFVLSMELLSALVVGGMVDFLVVGWSTSVDMVVFVIGAV